MLLHSLDFSDDSLHLFDDSLDKKHVSNIMLVHSLDFSNDLLGFSDTPLDFSDDSLHEFSGS